MPEHSILDRTSFASLSDDGQRTAVCELFDNIYSKSSRQNPGIKLQLDNDELFRDRKLIAASYEFYSSKIDETDPITFRYLKPEQREALEKDLLFSFYVMSAQYQLAAELSLDAAESRRGSLREYSQRIKQCADLLYNLRDYLPTTPEKVHARKIEGHDHLAYLGLPLAEVLAAGIGAIATGDPHAVEAWRSEGITVRAKDRRNAINAPRLYWVWAGSGLQSWISLLSDSYIHRQEALQALSAITPITGFLSYGLYLTNSSIEILMVAKHTLRCSWWTTEGEQKLKANAWQRFKAHADLRKFAIINDFIWGLGNLACFFWLTGNGMLGYYGNVATTMLLLMDVVISGFAYLEEKKQHEANLERYGRDISELKAKIADENTDENSKKILAEQLKTLEKAEARCRIEWTYKTYRLAKDIIYATVLILAFVTMCCFLLPPSAALAPATATLLSVGGGTLCFVASVVNDIASGRINILKSQALGQEAKTNVTDEQVEKGLLKKFQDECSKEGGGDPDVKRLLYIEMTRLRAEYDYQNEMAHAKTMNLLHDVFLKLFVPPLVFVSFIFFPLGIGTPILAVGLTLAIQSGKLYVGDEPDRAEFPTKLDENQYDAFEKKINRTFDDLPGFFAKSKPQVPAANDGHEDNAGLLPDHLK